MNNQYVRKIWSMVQHLDVLRSSLEYISEHWSEDADIENIMDHGTPDYPFLSGIDNVQDDVNKWVLSLFNKFRQEILVHAVLDGLHEAEEELNQFSTSSMFHVEEDDLKHALTQALEELDRR